MNASGTTDKHRFTSYERDSETETDHAVNRQYGQRVGRFMRVDPKASSARLGSPQSLNRYSYTHNEPVNQTDSLGLDLDNPFPDQHPAHPDIYFPPSDPRNHEHGPRPSWQRECNHGSSGLGIGIIDDGYGGSGGGRNREGPAIWSPPFGPLATPTCEIGAEFHGPLTGGVGLQFPDGGTTRGRTTTGLGDARTGPQPGWFWNFEVWARVSDFVQNWEIHQEAFIDINGTMVVVLSNGETIVRTIRESAHRRDGKEEKIQDKYIKQIRNHKWLFWVDAPGLPEFLNAAPYNLTVLITGKSWITQGRTKCEVNWRVKIEFTDGVLTLSEGRRF